MTSQFYLGADLGQANDYTALAVVQPFQPEPRDKTWRPPDRWPGRIPPQPPPDARKPPIQFHLRHLERLAHNVPYPDQVAHILGMLGSPALRGTCDLVVDATGVGRPVVDLFRKARVPRLVPITITGGIKVLRDREGWHVPKRDLVIGSQVLLQEGRLKIAEKLPLKDTFRQELLNFRVKIDKLTANDSYEGREGQHDDLVLAVALAVWQAARMTGALSVDVGGFKQTPRRFSSGPKE